MLTEVMEAELQQRVRVGVREVQELLERMATWTQLPGAKNAVSWRGVPGCTPRWRVMPACMHFHLSMCDRSLMNLHFRLEFFRLPVYTF